MNNNYLILVLQNIVLFPNQEVRLELSNEVSKSVIKNSINEYNREIIIVSPKDVLEVKPNVGDLPCVATLGKIKNNIILPNGNYRVTVVGIKRTFIDKYFSSNDFLCAKCKSILNPIYNKNEDNAYIRKLKKMVEEYVGASNSVSNSILESIKNISNLSKLTDVIAIGLDLSYENRWVLVTECDYYKRAKYIIKLLKDEMSSLEFDRKIEDELFSNLSSNEEKMLIKEKINVLSQKLGETHDILEDCDNFLNKINGFDLNDKSKNCLVREVNRLKRTVDTSPEFMMIRSYLEFVTDLPWNKSSDVPCDIKSIRKHLNNSHYGLDKAKKRIEEYLILKEHNENLSSPILCLVGPPGTGKTTFARELAKSINREFVKISVGGLNDAAELIGHRRTYVGSAPGKIMDGLKKSGVNNPIMLIDEVDKMVSDYKGEPSSVLLDVLDVNQNKEFTDNYVSLPFDLSNVLFILTANDEKNIPEALLDRLEIIQINSYTIYDKIEIVKKYTIPRLAKEYRFGAKKFAISDKAIIKIASEYTNEAGIRDLERHIASIIRKVLISNLLPIEIREEDVIKYLGKSERSYFENAYERSGTVNVPARSDAGGRIINIECAIYDGSEKIITTGSLGDVMKESIALAVSYLKSHAEMLKIDSKILSSTIHIHALESATRKDGPSAGLAITIAILSKILDKKVPNDSAFTGEMTLEGRILKVGGIKEKVISSYNRGIKRIFIPTENIGDIMEIPNKVSENINIVPVNNFTEVYEMVFEK